MKRDITVDIHKATELADTKTTASGIRNDFLEGTYPLFYHSYKPENSFIAVPPEWLRELAIRANEKQLGKELDGAIHMIMGEKARIIEKIKEKIKKNKNKPK